jgi:hypothetical protein
MDFYIYRNPIVLNVKLKLPRKGAKTEIFVLFLVTQCIKHWVILCCLSPKKFFSKNIFKTLDKYLLGCYYIRVRVQKHQETKNESSRN